MDREKGRKFICNNFISYFKHYSHESFQNTIDITTDTIVLACMVNS